MPKKRRDISKKILDKLYWVKKLNAYQIAKKLNCGSTTIYRLLKKYNIKVRDISESHIKYKRNNFSNNEIEKAYLIGFRLGDLHVRKAINSEGCKTIRIEAHTTKRDQITLFNELFKKYSHVHIKDINSKNKKTIRGLCFVDESFKFLLPKKDEIEKWIFKEERHFLSFISGYIDAEGHIGISFNGSPQLLIETQDKNIIKSIHKGLTKYGFHSPKPRLSRKAGYSSPSYPDRKSNKDHWKIAVYKADHLKRLLNILSLKHPKRERDRLNVLDYILWKK